MPIPPGFHVSGLPVSIDHVSSTVTTALATATTGLFQIATINPNPLSAATTASFPMVTSAAAPLEGENTGECQLLGPFAILIQGALGALALLSLVYKRWRERPQRPLKIWAFDVSKQVVGSILLHLANLVMSMFSAGQITAAATSAVKGTEYQPNPCSFYLLNLAIDTTIGIPILILLLHIFHAGFRLTPLARPAESIQSGNYGSPPRYTWWMKQSLIYFLGLLGMKFCVFILFQLLPWIGRVGDWALRWTEGNEAIQIAFVMLIFPLIMNAIQYYIIDIFIKKKQPTEDGKEDLDGGASHDGGTSVSSGDERGGLLSGHDDYGNPVDTHANRSSEPKNTNLKISTTRRVEEEEEDRYDEGHEDRTVSASLSSPPVTPDGKKGEARENIDKHDEDESILTKVPKPTE